LISAVEQTETWPGCKGNYMIQCLSAFGL